MCAWCKCQRNPRTWYPFCPLEHDLVAPIKLMHNVNRLRAICYYHCSRNKKLSLLHVFHRLRHCVWTNTLGSTWWVIRNVIYLPLLKTDWNVLCLARCVSSCFWSQGRVWGEGFSWRDLSCWAQPVSRSAVSLQSKTSVKEC